MYTLIQVSYYTRGSVSVRTITVLSQKGGAGKTTLALNLAVAAERAGKSAAIIDLDPQASAALWGDAREAGTPAVVSAQAARLSQILTAAEENGAELVVIDTAPHSENSALSAARVSDLCLIPCRPAVLDLRAIGTSIDLVRLAKKDMAVVLNATPPQGHLADEAAEVVESYGVPLAPVRLVQRIAYVHAITAGKAVQEYEPKGRAANEIATLYTWICTQLHV